MAGRLRDDPDEINAKAAKAARPEHVRRALDLLRPGLVADGGNAELVGIGEDGTVHVEMQGECKACPAREMTRKLVLEPALRARVPGVRTVLLA
jgi:Fe-S cluster biogenesis protein NfuA